MGYEYNASIILIFNKNIMKIAIVEDDLKLARWIEKKLRREWYDTVMSYWLEEFKRKILDDADLFIIDLSLPDWNWFEIIDWLRRVKKTNKPILIMSAITDIDSKLKWFNMWIDDYICKPMVPIELVARVWVLLRRNWSAKKNIFKYNGYTYNFKNNELFKGKVNLNLSRKEAQIIEFFIINKWKVVTKDMLIKSIWWKVDLLAITYNNINVTIHNLRKKIWDKFGIETIVWAGYIFR